MRPRAADAPGQCPAAADSATRKDTDEPNLPRKRSMIGATVGDEMTRWQRAWTRPLLLGAFGAVLALLPAIALAHPLGNFTVNRYSRIAGDGAALRIFSVLDVAEIPAAQESQAADTDRDGAVSPAEWDAYRARKVEDLRRGLELTIDGAPVQLETEESTLSTPPGQAGLPLLRIEARFWARWSGGPGEHRAAFRDGNDPSRIGWREIVVRPGPGLAILRSTAPADDVSDELRSYPEGMLQSPLDRRTAEWTFTLAAGAAGPPSPALLATGTVARPADAFTSLITASELNPGVILFALLAAAVLGGIHAASPGHGKTVMAAYIVGTRGTFKHAVALALSVTVSHTFGVLALGAITVFASNLIFPEQLYPWLTLISGLIVVVIGLGLLLRLTLGWRTSRGHLHDHGHHHDHGHGSGHDPDEAHEHEPWHEHGHRHDLPLTWRNLFALGFAGGIIPSASALVVLLSAIALGRLGFGLTLIVAFGVGMAVVLTAAGVLLVHGGRLIARYFPDAGSPGRRALTRLVPVVSALVMTAAGSIVTLQALGQFGLVRF